MVDISLCSYSKSPSGHQQTKNCGYCLRNPVYWPEDERGPRQSWIRPVFVGMICGNFSSVIDVALGKDTTHDPK